MLHDEILDRDAWKGEKNPAKERNPLVEISSGARVLRRSWKAKQPWFPEKGSTAAGRLAVNQGLHVSAGFGN